MLVYLSKIKNYQAHASLIGTLHKKGGKSSHIENKEVEFSEFILFGKNGLSRQDSAPSVSLC